VSLLDFDVYGVQRVLTNLTRTAEAAHDAITPALVKAGLVVAGQAKVLCPVDTGALQNSIGVERNTPGPGDVTVSATMEYAAYVEWGTSRRAAQPYMRPALDAKRRQIVDLVGEDVFAEIASVLPDA
jgi:HK97 gp10 family phage protein